MKFQKEFTFSVKNEVPKVVITGVDLLDVVANITYLVHYIYGRFKGINPELGGAFRDMLVQVISDPDSPCWEDVKDTPGATEICFAIPREGDDGALPKRV